MSKLINTDKEYKDWISKVSHRYRISQIKAVQSVNIEMLRFYWSLGEDIARLKAESRWGNNFFKDLSMDLRANIPQVKCFSQTNLYYIKRFYLLYNKAFVNSPQVEATIENELKKK